MHILTAILTLSYSTIRLKYTDSSYSNICLSMLILILHYNNTIIIVCQMLSKRIISPLSIYLQIDPRKNPKWTILAFT